MFQITFNAARRVVLFPDPDRADAAMRLLGTVAGHRGLLLFGFDHTHVHLVVSGNRLNAGRTARCYEIWLKRQGLFIGRWAPARITAIHDQRHLHQQIQYLHRQRLRQLGAELPDWRWSSSWDLLGLRCLPGYQADGLRRRLPDLTEADLLDAVGLPWRELGRWKPTPTPDEIAAAGFLVQGLSWSPDAPADGPSTRARAVAVQLADSLGVCLQEMEQPLGRRANPLRKLRRRPVPHLLLAAKRLLAFRDRARADGRRRVVALPKRIGESSYVLVSDWESDGFDGAPPPAWQGGEAHHGPDIGPGRGPGRTSWPSAPEP